MKFVGIVVAGLGLGLAIEARAFVQPDHEPLPEIDRRRAADEQSVLPEQRAAAETLRARVGAVRVEFDPVTGAPASVSAGDGFLSGRGGQGRTVSASARASFAPADPDGPLKAFLREHTNLFGFGPEALETARIVRSNTGPANGLRSIVWEQQVAGIPVFEGLLVAHTTKAGELVNLSARFLRDAVKAAERGMTNRAAVVTDPPVGVREAVALAAKNLGDTGETERVTAVAEQPEAGPRKKFVAPFLRGEAEATLTWLPMDAQTLRLCWDIILTGRQQPEMFRVLVDAQNGEVLLRRCLTSYISDVSYRVYTSDSPSPFSPGYSTPASTQPALVPRSLVTLPALDTNASPAGWIDDGGNETRGNNVDAHTDRNNDNVPDLPRPQGSPSRVFDFSLDLASQDPTNYSSAAVVQLFYLCNWMHDKLYALGFTETAGNFQSNNFGRGGLGNDALQADAQDGSGVNNANMSTPPEGSPPRMQMYIFTGPSPRRDGDLDAEVVLHEYTHGLSNRRVGGGVGISALQSSGMGEGWSDFYALSLLSEASDDVNGNYAAGGYASYLISSGFQQNYYFGIRRYPYTTDLTKNPLTFRDIDPAQASAHSGIPRSPAVGTTANEVHNMGEVWCVTLWDVRANLINKYGWAIGNQLALQLVTDGMSLSPANPTFVQARDGILQADLVDNGGANRPSLWAAFAKRGLGQGATSPASSTTTGVHEDFSVPDDLSVTPATGFTSSGQVGGPFTPACQSFSILNAGTNSLAWTASASQPWVTLSLAAGNLSPGAATNVNVCLTSSANAFTAGVYSATLTFSNAVSGIILTRPVSLTVSPPRIVFFPLDTDPGWTRQGQWAFGKPSGLGGTTHGFPDPANGATGSNVFGVNLGGDYSTSVGGPYYLTAGPFNCAGYTGVKLQFQRWLNTDYPSYVYATIDVSTNGSSWINIWTNPSNVAITDSTWNQLTYDISAYANNRTNVFIRWGHRVGASGAFAYSGWNIDDIALLGTPIQSLALSMPTNAAEGSVVSATVSVNPVPTNDLVITLSSSDTTEVTVPPTVTIPAGGSNLLFDVSVLDDGVLDGTQSAVVTASAAGYNNANATISVLDNATATLTVLLPATVTEGQGSVQGTVQVSAVPAANISVSLSSSDTTEIQVPASVILQAGQTSAVFTATIVDDNLFDGPQNATVTAHVQNWTDGAANVTVLDNETTNLTVSLPAQASEGAGVLNNAGSVSIAGILPTNLVVSLVSSDPARLGVPSTATVLAGQTTASFNLSIIDNNLPDGNHTAGVLATADGFAAGTNSLTILDDDPDHFAFSTISSPQTAFVSFTITISARNATNGIVTGFIGAVSLVATGAQGQISVTPANSTSFSAGQWTGSISIGSAASNVVVTAADSKGHVGNSNPFLVIRPPSVFIPASSRVDMVQDDARGLLYISGGNQVLRYDLNSGSFLSPFVFGTNLYGLDISPDNNTLVVADVSSFSSTSVWVHVVDLPTGNVRKGQFDRAFGEGGTYAVAFGNDGAAVISSTYQGSGWVPLRRYEPATELFTNIGNPRQSSMVSASGDGRIVAIAEANISSGPLDRYDVAARTITGSVGDGWFNFECAVNRNGSQYAVPTYGGTFIYGTNLEQLAVLGTYATEGPIGLAYHPQADLVFFAWWPTTYIRAYETHTLAEVARYDCGYSFGWTGNGAFGQGRLRTSRDGNNLFVTVSGGVRWISRYSGPPADLALSVSTSPNPGVAGSNLTWSITLSNQGPNAVTDARVFDRLPSGVSFVSASSPQGLCTLSNGLVTCTLNPLNSGATASVNIVVLAPFQAQLTNNAAVVSSAADPVASNNAVTTITTVNGTASLVVTPATGLTSSGSTGGPFAPANQIYALTNNGTAPVNWAAGYTAGWLSLSATSGSLQPGAGATVTVSINSSANALAAGNYNDSVTFTNLINGTGTTSRAVSLAVIPVGILGVTPATNLLFAGPPGGPFAPASQSLFLTNSGDGSLNWTAAKGSAWLGISPPGGSLAPGATDMITAVITDAATNLAHGVYSDTIGLTNLSSGRGNTSRPVTLLVNRGPSASPQTVSLAEDSSLPITLQGTDADGDTLTAIITSLPTNGILYQTTNGTTPSSPITSLPATVTYPGRTVIFTLPQHGFGTNYGNFQFKVNDGITDSAPALVTVNVTHVNHGPVAAPDTATFLVGAAQVPFNVLANDSDVDGDPLTVQSFTTPGRGTLTQTTNGQFTFRPNPAFVSGQDQFTYTIDDGHGGNATAQVVIRAYTRPLDGTSWSTFGNGPSHTGYYPAMLGRLPFTNDWSVSVSPGGSLNQVAVGDGKVYVTPVTYFGSTFIVALDAITGQQIWRRDFTSAFSINPPTYDNDRVYLQRGNHASDTQLWCLNSGDGSVIWSAAHAAQWERYYAPTVFGDGIWVDGGYYGGMYGFGTNGTQRFFYSALAQYDQWTPTWYQGTVYSWVEGVLRAHDPISGSLLWSASFGWNWDGWSMNTVAALDNGFAFVAQRPNLIAVDLSTHAAAWSTNTSIKGSPAVANGVVYALSGDKVFAWVGNTGAPAGTYQATNDTGLGGQPIVTDDALLVASGSATYIFDLATRQVLQTLPYGGSPSVANGRLYLASGDSVRSFVVQGTKNPAFTCSVLDLKNGLFRISFKGLSGWSYRIQYTESLDAPVWQDLTTVTAFGTGGHFIDLPPTNAPVRFYRVVWP